MRPHDSKAHSRKMGVARGKMFLNAHLGWLPGFPIGSGNGHVKWLFVPSHDIGRRELILLTREHMSQATFIWNKLVYRFPHALPQIVPDRDRWVEMVPAVLDLLKASIHSQKNYPSCLFRIQEFYPARLTNQALKFYDQYSALAPFLDAASWSFLFMPNELIKLLEWAKDNTRALLLIMELESGIEGAISIFKIWDVRKSVGDTLLSSLMAYLNDERVQHVNPDAMAAEHDFYIEQLLRAAEWTGYVFQQMSPEPPLSYALLNFLSSMHRKTNKSRRKALELFNVIYPPDIFVGWDDWYEREKKHYRKARKILFSLPKDSDKKYRSGLKSFAKRLKAEHKAMPHRPRFKLTLDYIAALIGDKETSISTHILKALQLFPVVYRGN